MHGYVLSDFAKPERATWLPTLIEAVTREASALVAGDQGRFMSRVTHAVFPPPPKPAKPATPADQSAEAAPSDATPPKDGA